jgi:hypothetical protein
VEFELDQDYDDMFDGHERETVLAVPVKDPYSG